MTQDELNTELKACITLLLQFMDATADEVEIDVDEAKLTVKKVTPDGTINLASVTWRETCDRARKATTE